MLFFDRSRLRSLGRKSDVLKMRDGSILQELRGVRLRDCVERNSFRSHRRPVLSRESANPDLRQESEEVDPRLRGMSGKRSTCADQSLGEGIDD